MNDMGNLTTPPEVAAKKTKKKTNGWKWVSLVLIVALIASVAASLLGFIKISVGEPKAQASVCSNEIVTRYNEVSEYKIRGDADSTASVTMDTPGLQQVISEVTATDGYEDDATCQTLRFLAAILQEEYETAKAASASVRELHQQGKYANSNIRDNPPIFLYDSWTDALNPATKDESADERGQ